MPPGNGEKKAVSVRNKKTAVSCHAVTDSFFLQLILRRKTLVFPDFCPGQNGGVVPHNIGQKPGGKAAPTFMERRIRWEETKQKD